MNRVVRRWKRDGSAAVARAVATRLGLVADRSPMQRALARLSRQDHVCIVQIGAFVGNTFNDPLWEFFREYSAARPAGALHGVLVEPVGAYFEQLTKNYASIPGVDCVNAAIAERAGERDIHRLGVDPTEHGMPAWLAQLSSLKSERITSLWDNDVQDPDHDKYKRFVREHTITERVQCLTFDMLFERHGVTAVDLLQLDVEGYEYELLRQLDFSRWKPRYINLERTLLQENEEACWTMLREAGYTFEDSGDDTFCTRR